ncbi:YqhG family protein [Pontibacillus litoralis]|uniref:YqhG n=1 Tax=Pontibacillus litoralis JSM 072002 TaxID=1385512 RepID=A0A0A5GCM4_9BACI|nr:YqhG family protein [Pontibacillus litoralis]KGX88865.1 hypothetical protein N784_00495 [Pontibacillus litoralis JSM 072002]
MEQAELHNFLTRYFTANQCNIIQDKDGMITVQLTEQLDEQLMNRPFYWNYVKRVGGRGMPMKVTFITNPAKKEEEGEWIHFGSPRLHQMFHTLKQTGKITRQYESKTGNTNQTSLIPWLILNVSVHYQGVQKRNELLSLGINLINGAILPTFMDRIQTISFSPIIHDYCFTLTPIIRTTSALNRLERYIQNDIHSQDDAWVQEAHQTYKEEKELLDYFFQLDTHSNATDECTEEERLVKERYKSELATLQERLLPTISTEVINTGMLYISQQTTSQLLQQ